MKQITAFFAIILFVSCRTPSGSPTSLPALETIYADSAYQITGVAVSKAGRLFTNYPRWSSTYRYAVVEIKHGKGTPYPDTTYNSWTPADTSLHKWICAMAVTVDDQDKLWVVDPASPYLKGVVNNGQKLVRINLLTDSVERTYLLAGATDNGSYLNDVRVDTHSQTAYLTNSSEGGIVIVDLATGHARQVLQGTSSVMADTTYHLTYNQQPVKANGLFVHFNSDGIALSPDEQYLYYKPLTDDKLYRIKTDWLRDASLPAAVLASRVELLGHFTTTDGMIMDKHGNLYLGDLEKSAIIKIDTALHQTTLVSDPRLVWPDSYQITDDGYLYISCSQIQQQPPFNEGVDKRTAPYSIFRVKLPD
jgi:sugar lactone lactonase YvrE